MDKKAVVVILGIIIVCPIVLSYYLFSMKSPSVKVPSITFEESSNITYSIGPLSTKTISLDYENITFAATIVKFSDVSQAKNFTGYVMSYMNMTNVESITIDSFKGHKAQLIKPDPTAIHTYNATGLVLSKNNIVLLFMGHTLNFDYAELACKWFIKNYKGLE